MKKHALLSIILVFILALSVIIPNRSAVAATDGATVTLAVDATSFGPDQPVIVHVTLTNATDHPMKVLKWQTLADDVEGPLFSIQRDGLPVAYIGPLYKRPAPTHENYLYLKAGESITHDVDIAMYYDLSISGVYRISYDVATWDLYSEKGGHGKEMARLTSDEISVMVSGRENQAVSQEAKKVSGSTSFNQCTTSQQSTLISARTQASAYSADALSYQLTGKQGARYTTWFGSYDASRYDTVTNHFTNISNAMDNAAVTFDCGCNKKYYAYVYPNQPYTIYLCRVFWVAPLAGTDSKAGTLIHEMSHFNTVAKTSDWVYGQSGAMNLAITDPAKAITNADNHEYFAENTPPLR